MANNTTTEQRSTNIIAANWGCFLFMILKIKIYKKTFDVLTINIVFLLLGGVEYNFFLIFKMNTISYDIENITPNTKINRGN